MPQAILAVTLPFPVRVGTEPYSVTARSVTWKLSFRRVQQIDRRIAESGAFDLQVDRTGMASYSAVTGVADFRGAPEQAFGSFLTALNAFISIFRDLFGVYWIRPLEPEDLLRPSVIVGNEGLDMLSAGRAGGITLPVEGLSEAANSRLVTALSEGKLPPNWRQMQLDAVDLMGLGRYSTAVVLGWSALESACRQTLPGLAYQAGLDPVALAKRLDPNGRGKSRPPWSLEEAVERISNGHRVVEVTADLATEKIYHPESVGEAVYFAYMMRNKTVHQGAVPDRAQTDRALGAIDNVLGQALDLRGVEPPPADLSWRSRYGEVPPYLAKLLASSNQRLVIAWPPSDGFLRVERIGKDLWARLGPEVGADVAEVFVVCEVDSWKRQLSRTRPRLVVDPSSPWLTGLTSELAGVTEECVRDVASYKWATHEGLAADRLAEYATSWNVARIESMPPLDPNDGRTVLVPVRLAAFLSIIPARADEMLEPLRAKHPSLVRRTKTWAEQMALIDPDDEHSYCAVFRLIHDDCFWLDTIRVECPVERVTYGSRRSPWDERPRGTGEPLSEER